MSDFTVYTNDQLSNEAYHADEEYISGSSLARIFGSCLAKWRYDEAELKKEKAKPLAFGTVSHAQVLEPETFDAGFYRMPDVDIDHPGKESRPITSVSGLQGWLKERGVAGRSSPDSAVLIAKIRETCAASGEAPPLFWHEIVANAEKEAGERMKVPGKDYDLVQRMREVLFKNAQYARILTGGTAELSIFGTLFGMKCKVRFDRVTDDAEIWDYKTTSCAEPGKFTRHAFDLNYPLKMALQYHMFKAAYGVNPGGVVLLAQEKEPPFLPLEFRLTQKTLLIGTAQLRQAISMLQYARDNDIYPGYNGGNAYDLDPPFYVENQYKHLFEDIKPKK